VYVVNEFASVTTYNRNLTSGALNQVSNIGGWTNTPNEIVLSYDGKNAYVLEQGQPGYVKVFDRDLTNGILTFASSIAAGSLSLGIEISPDDKNVYVTNNVDNNLSIFTRNLSTGALSGTTTISTGSGPVEVVISPDGKNVYVSESGYTQISIFDRDLTNGSLSGSSTLYYSQQSFGVVISSNGENIYVSNYNDNSVTIIDRDTTNGSLSIASTVSTGANTLPYGIAISPDSKNVYVTSSANAINPGLCVFTRNLSTGSLSGLTFIASSANAVPTRVEVSSDNKNVYMTNQGNDTVSVFDRNISTGALTLASTLATGTAPQGLAVYPTAPTLGITFKFVAENDPNSIYSISAVEIGSVNGKKFFTQIGTASNNSSHIFWNGTYWFYNRGNGTTIYFNSTNSALPPSGLWQPASDLPPGPWIPAQGFTTGTLTYEYIYTPPFVEPDYLCVTGNSGYNNPSFNGQYYGYGGAGWVHIGVSWQTNDGSTTSNIATFYTQSTSAYESTTGLTTFYQSSDINIFGYPAPTVSLGTC
jgi:DNA-binding beta-propeller fold protein YncE